MQPGEDGVFTSHIVRRNGAAHDVDPSPKIAFVGRMATEPRWAEIGAPSRAPGKWLVDSAPKKRPDIEVFDAGDAVHKMLRASLAERQQDQSVLVCSPDRRSKRLIAQHFLSNLGEAREIVICEGLETALGFHAFLISACYLPPIGERFGFRRHLAMEAINVPTV